MKKAPQCGAFCFDGHAGQDAVRMHHHGRGDQAKGDSSVTSCPKIFGEPASTSP